MSLITAPTILVAIDDSIDVSVFYSITEEEEKKGNEKNKEFEVLVIISNSDFEGFNSADNKEDLEYQFKTYSKPHLNLISPPPEFIS